MSEGQQKGYFPLRILPQDEKLLEHVSLMHG